MTVSGAATGGGVLLLVEDDDAIGRLVKSYLEQQDGWRVLWLRSGEDAIAELRRHPVRLVVLDIGLPGIDGFEVCRTMRAHSKVPIVMLTARDEEPDRVAGLELGADDYVTKPFSLEELVSRVRAILRREERGRLQAPLVRRFDGLELDYESGSVSRGGLPVLLTRSEFRLLGLLAEHPGEVVSRREILEHLWHSEFVGDERAGDIHVSNLRRKLGRATIETIRGEGYRLRA